jgi:carbon starvation protein
VAALATAVVLGALVLGYRFYGRWIGRRIYAEAGDDAFQTPAHTQADGHDFVATPKHVLFGHHFTSIAGAAPIIGPCVAAYWGWLPALVWVVLGTIFMGAVHDFGALVASAREGGRSIADIAAGVMSGRARTLFLCFVLVLVWLVLAVFAMAIAGLFVSTPSSVLPINIEIVIAVAIGWLLHRRKAAPLVPSILALVALYFFVWVGVHVPVDLVAMGVEPATATRGWIVVLFAYSAIASLLPVWLLLQPRDYINSHQLVVGLGLLFVGLFVAQPSFDAPAIRIDEGSPSLFPLLFVTIACGAISGFHGLVSSGTTSKQLDRIGDARAIGYGAMLGEGSLALASTMAAVAGIGLVAACHLPGQGAVEDLSWGVYYDSWAHAGQNKAAAFVLGGGAFLEALGLPRDLSQTIMAVLVISFAATTLDTATRIQRFILAELGAAIRIASLQNPYVATLLAVAPAMLLAFWDVPDPNAPAQTTQAAWVLWPIFGASNQMLAALTLMVLALYYSARKRPVLPLLIPMVFILGVTVIAMFAELASAYARSNWVMLGLATLMLALQLWMLVEGAIALRARRHKTLRVTR